MVGIDQWSTDRATNGVGRHLVLADIQHKSQRAVGGPWATLGIEERQRYDNHFR